MKLAYSTLASPNWDWQKSIAAAKHYGYDGIEWRLVDGQVVKPEFPLDQCRQIEAAVSAAGLQTCALDSGASLAHPAGADRDRHLSEIKSLLHKANALKTHILRVFPGKYPESVSDEQAMEWVIENLNHLVPEARRLDVSIALELHDLFDWDRKAKRGTTTSTFLARVLAEVTAPEVGVQWDLGNPYQEGETAEETWNNLPKERLIYVHAKDMRPKSDGKWEYVAMGSGVIPLSDVVTWLKSIGFDGWVSFEWEKKWHPEIAEPEVALPQFIEFMRPLLA